MISNKVCIYLLSFDELGIEVVVLTDVQMRGYFIVCEAFEHPALHINVVIELILSVIFQVVDHGYFGRIEFQQQLMGDRRHQTTCQRHRRQVYEL